ncbi:Cytochrome b561 and DOMON domain-containing protein [Abeliophyllum distichum]|uniref:Cytochrome b561 and DOMON domain-containing protein n=1 Tax=Abeliophyllum distichum TaxID=126358 RepID=A0ABD1PB78_9LAMI
MGWLAWGLHPQRPHMVGTRALIGIKHKNDSLEFHKYNITDATRLGWQLLPIDDLGLDIRTFSFFYLEAISYYMIKATDFLPLGYNSSRTNIVWQIGYATADKESKMNPTSLKNFDCAETIDLNSNQVITYKAHSRRNLRIAQWILIIMGWGTFLPVGVIIASWVVLGLWLGKQSKYYCFRTHGIFGIVIFTFTTIQMFALRLKPKHTDPYRDYWNMYHYFLGYALLTLISINIFKGIAILKPEDTWKWTYIGVLGFLAITALAFEDLKYTPGPNLF